jgi:hypothetical protein
MRRSFGTPQAGCGRLASGGAIRARRRIGTAAGRIVSLARIPALSWRLTDYSEPVWGFRKHVLVSEHSANYGKSRTGFVGKDHYFLG